jgi:hypothetical protein
MNEIELSKLENYNSKYLFEGFKNEDFTFNTIQTNFNDEITAKISVHNFFLMKMVSFILQYLLLLE